MTQRLPEDGVPPTEAGWWLDDFSERAALSCGRFPMVRYSGDLELPEHGYDTELTCLRTTGECRGL